MGVLAVDPLEEVPSWLHPHGPRQVSGEVFLDSVVLLLLQGLNGVRKITRHSFQVDGYAVLQDGGELSQFRYRSWRQDMERNGEKGNRRIKCERTNYTKIDGLTDMLADDLLFVFHICMYVCS